jgi:hypothetical protein
MSIKPLEFQYKESRWQDLYTHLKNEGFDVYAPEQKAGECTHPYIVVRYDSAYKHEYYSSMVDTYSIECYVPRNQYSKLESLIMSVKSAMKKIYPLFQDYGQQMFAFYDDVVKAHYATIVYANYKKL